MRQYLDLLRQILDSGVWKAGRAALPSTGQKPRCLSLFGLQARYDLREGFPIVTTKKVPFRQVACELLWFLSGSTNNNDLARQGVNIWSEWAAPSGELGPIYGHSWRQWPATTGKSGALLDGYPFRCSLHFDQIRWLVDNVRAVKNDPEHPSARRLMLSAWNPPEMPLCHGPPGCHTLAQFDVCEGRLSCQMYQRSADMFLGVPWNVALYALLTHLMARATGLDVGELVHTLGSAHVYENHLEAVRQQLEREPRPLPRLVLDDSVIDVDGLNVEQMRLEGYQHHPALKGEVAV